MGLKEMNYKTRSATEFEIALSELVDTDDAIGEVVQTMALHAKVVYLETQNEEISQELDDVRVWLDRVKSSWRYKVGHLIIRPIEMIIRK